MKFDRKSAIKYHKDGATSRAADSVLPRFLCSGSHLTILVSKELDSLICLNGGLAMTEKLLIKCRKYDASR